MSQNGRVTDHMDEEPDEQSRAELATQLQLLVEENRRLRESYIHAKQTQYRRTAVGLATVGAIAVAAALVLPTVSTVLFALGGAGLFGAILTYYLTPEEFIAGDVGRDVYASIADNQAAIAGELGLSAQRVYIPIEQADTPVRLFIPQHDDYELPASTALAESTIVATDTGTRGLSLTPSGSRLFQSLESGLTGELGETPDELAGQLTDALVEQFELVDAADPEVEADGQRATIAVTDSVYGPLTQFDHPVVSLLAAGLACGLGTPIATEVTEATDGRAEYLVTLRWETDPNEV